jgi:hypothetical protein
LAEETEILRENLTPVPPWFDHTKNDVGILQAVIFVSKKELRKLMYVDYIRPRNIPV